MPAASRTPHSILNQSQRHVVAQPLSESPHALLQSPGPGWETPCEARSGQAHQQKPNDIHIPPQCCAVALPACRGQHVVHPVTGQVLVHSSICPGGSEAQQLALPCCNSSVHVLQVGALTVLHLHNGPCRRAGVSTLAAAGSRRQKCCRGFCWGCLPVPPAAGDGRCQRGTGCFEGVVDKGLAGYRQCNRCWPVPAAGV